MMCLVQHAHGYLKILTLNIASPFATNSTARGCKASGSGPVPFALCIDQGEVHQVDLVILKK